MQAKRIPLLETLVIGGLLAAAASANPIVVNGVFTGSPDHLELYNCSSSAVDVSGWTVQTFYSTSAVSPTLETAFTIPAGTTIAPGGFLILQEFGTAGSPGTLPDSISVGFNYFWVAARTVGAIVTDDTGNGIDYVFYDHYGFGGSPNLPAGTSWTGSYTSGSPTDAKDRVTDSDTDDAADWGFNGAASAAALNAGQTTGVDCSGGGGGGGGGGGAAPVAGMPALVVLVLSFMAMTAVFVVRK